MTTTTTELRKRKQRDFTETHWSLVKAAGDRACPTAAAALDTLCQRYWPPIYVYVRKRGYSKHDAEDLTQRFFGQIIDKNAFGHANQAKGKFRSYLLRALHRFLTDDWDKRRAQKRGSGATPLSLEAAEAKYSEIPSPDLTPERAFDHRWRLILLEQGLKRLEEESKAEGKQRQFAVLRPYLGAEFDRSAAEQVAHELNVSLNTARVLALRFRQRYRDCVSAELADTVTSPEELEEERRELFGTGR